MTSLINVDVSRNIELHRPRGCALAMIGRRLAPLWGLLMLLAAGWLTASAQAAPRPIPIAAYWQKLNDTDALAVRLEGAAADAARPRLAAEAQAWTGINSVTL